MKTKPAPSKQAPRSGTTLSALLIGLPLAGAVLAAVHFGVIPAGSLVHHYLKFPAEQASLTLFCCALGTLAGKLWQNLADRRACRLDVVPRWDGKPVAAAEAGKLLGSLARLSGRLRRTWLVQRVQAVLDFLVQRGSAHELDDQLRSLADNDAIHLESSYALTRFITWAIPILGFLGTVLGITGAISGVTPEVLEHNMNRVTDGLSEAFDSTAVALALTMITMFMSFLVEKAEQAVLDVVDHYVDEQLAHRFVRLASDTEPFVAVVQQNSRVLLETTDRLVQRQAQLWSEVIDETAKRHGEANAVSQQRLVAGLESALERTLQAHARRLGELEKQSLDGGARLLEQLAGLAATVRDTSRDQQAGLGQMANAIASQAQALGELQEQEKHLVHLQSVLQQNLAALTGAGAFEQAVHTLTAAIHLLTSRALPAAHAGVPAMPSSGKDNPLTLAKLSLPPGMAGQTGKAA
jgi:biopolymer transport protein ExbB/TolQ